MEETRQPEHKGHDRTTLTLKRHSPLLEQGELVVIAEKKRFRFLVQYNDTEVKFREVK